ncbi:MAG TPA: exodeoxyribonuclease VII small subunit [Geopsychrobacteraceae bacterium]|nr:exodeoxyribonuclease VII small subunit [Geopsychrobacteraceae bacterium]
MAARKGYEESIKELEEAVELLEGGELSLEQSLKIFKNAVKHISDCRKALEKTELEVSKLRKQEDGSFIREPFNE